MQADHSGVDRTIRLALSRYWWPTLRRDITQHITKCISCARHKSHPASPVPMLVYPIPERPWDTVGTDLLKLPRATSGYQYSFVCFDHFSRYVILASLHDKSAPSVAHALVTCVSNPYTAPKVILPDNGTESKNELIAQLCAHFNIRQSFIVAHHPASNGLVERTNRKILKALRYVTNGVSQTWDKWLSHIAASISASCNASISESPLFVLFGENKRLPYDVLLSKPQPRVQPGRLCKITTYIFSAPSTSVTRSSPFHKL